MSLLSTGLMLFTVATVGGAINSVAGGGSFLTFPTLLLAGLPGISANATNNTAMWLGTAASAHGYREELKQTRAFNWPLIWSSSIGSLLGALLVLATPEVTFVKAIPFLLLAATLLFISGPVLARRHAPRPEPVELPRWGLPVQFLLGIYGGYFGAGVGIATLALLTQMGFKKIHQMNGLKTLLTACMNGVAVVPFALAGTIAWRWALVMCVGAMTGGYVGARLARRAHPWLVRAIVTVLAIGMTAYFFWKTYFAAATG